MDLGADLKGEIEKARNITWMVGMFCPVKACGSETYLTLDSFSNHWIRTHHLELNMFQCSRCAFKAIQKSELENHLKSHHWIHAEKDVKTALTNVKVVKVLNPAFKDTEGYYFGSSGTEKEGECSLSDSETRPSEPASDVTTADTIEALMESTKKSPSENEELGFKSLSSKSAAGEKEPIKVEFVSNMSCPVDKCGTHAFTSLTAFEDHWTKRHLPVRDHFKCKICKIGNIVRMSTYWHIKTVHGIKYSAIEKYIYKVSDTNSQFLDPGPLYFEKCSELAQVARSTIVAKSPLGIQKKENKVSLDTSQASVESTKNSSSENQEIRLKCLTSKSAAGKKEPIKVVFVNNMSCPIDKCGTHVFTKLSKFKQHWRKKHLPFQEYYICKICNLGKTARNSTYWYIKNVYWHIENVHGMKYPAIEQNVSIGHSTNCHFVDPDPFYLEGCFSELVEVAKSTDGSKSASAIQKKDEKDSTSTSEKEMPKIVVEWKYNMTCPIHNCDSKMYQSWTMYCQHWKMVHEQRYLKNHACPKCSYQSRQTSYLISHIKHCHNLVGKELDRAVEEIQFVDVENPSFIDPGNYTCNWFGKSSKSENSTSTALSETVKIEVTLQKATEERSPKKFKFAPGMPCPVKNCSPVQISSYSAFVQHWNEQHALMLKKFACTVCDFKHIQKSIVFMHVRKEHGMPSHVVTNKITTVTETNVKAEELYVPELPTDHRRSIIMVKPDDSGQFNTYDTNGGKIKEATDVVEELKKSDEKIGKLDEEKDESEKDESKGQMDEDTCTGLRDEMKPLESTHLADVNREKALTNNTAQRVYKSSDKDIKLRMSASDNHQNKGQFNTYDTNGGKIKEATDVVEELRKSEEKIGKLDEEKDESKGQMDEDTCTGLRDEMTPSESTQLADVNRENVLTNNTAQRVYKSSDKDIKLRTYASENHQNKEVSLQKKPTEPSKKEERYPNKSKFAPGMPYPVKNCSPVHTRKKFACTLCDFMHIHRSIVFMHVRNEHGMPSHVVKKKITKVKETRVKAEELYVPTLPTDRRRSMIMVKPDDSEVSLWKKPTEPSKKEERYPKKLKFEPGMPCPVKNCSPVQISSYSSFVQHWNERHAVMQKKFACTVCDFKHIERSVVFTHVRKEHGMPSHVVKKKITMVKETNMKPEELYVPELPTDHRRSMIMVKSDDSEARLKKKATEPAQKKQRYPNRLKFAPGMPCPVKNCSTVQISSYSLLEHHWNERHGLMIKKFACTVCDFKHIQKSVVFMHVRKEHDMPSHVAAAKITTVMETNSQYVDPDELYFPEFPTEDRKLILMVKSDGSETGVLGEVLPDSSAVTVQMEAKPLVFPKDVEDVIEKELHSVKGRVESTKDEVKTDTPSGSSNVPKIVAEDEDLISDFKEDSLGVDMSEFICIDEIGYDDAETNEESPEKQSAKETELSGDQEHEIQDEVSSPTEHNQIEDMLRYFVCIDDIGDEEGS